MQMKNDKTIENPESKVLLLCLLVSLAIFLVDSFLPLGVAGGVPYILVVLLSLWSPRKKLPYYAAICVTILTLAGYLSSPPGGELWKVISNRFLALFAIWTTAIMSVQRKTILEEKEKALFQLRTLRGFLPICASCKKIKDEGGGWSQIEAYIRDHSEAEFSHGICPDCARKLYPDAEINIDEETT